MLFDQNYPVLLKHHPAQVRLCACNAEPMCGASCM
jgi:hypothetical protein